tara:strand:- start:805 stop:1056 length:252 start_codon:yes stop_codon:yes gene_type:complete
MMKRNHTGKGTELTHLPMTEKLHEKQNSVKCWCQTCCKNETGYHHLFRMVLCPECGSKRCPRATNHELECTGSNEAGQEGSIY